MLYNQSKFAREAKRSRSAISKSIKKGRLVIRPDGKLDSENAVNKDYLLRNQKAVQQAGKAASKNKNQKADNTLSDNDKGLSDKSEIDLKKAKEQLRRLRIQNEKELKLLIDRTIVQEYFGKVSSIMIKYFSPMGGQLAPILAGNFNSNNPEQILNIKSEIDKEISRALEQFKKECDDILKDMQSDL